MHGTWILQRTKGIFAALHQPAELTPRDSQRLLDALTSSFRSHLARNGHHGHDAAASPPASHLASPAHMPSSPITAPPSSSQASVQTSVPDQHLRSILDNPLFRHAPCPRPSLVTPPQPAAQSQQLQLHSTDVFERAVARGLMTIQRAHGFLLHTFLQCPWSGPCGRELRGARAGFLVLQWLQASGQERHLSFLSVNHRFTSLLVRFMIAEGLEHVVWTWIERLLRGDGPAEVTLNSLVVPSAASLVENIAFTHSRDPKLDALHQVLLRAETLYRNASAPCQHLAPYWRGLAWHATAESWRHLPPSRSLFDAIFALRARLGLHGASASMAEAHLDLYHPTLPSPARALTFFRRQTVWDRQLAACRARQEENAASDRPRGKPEDSLNPTLFPSFAERLKCLGLDTVRVLTDLGDRSSAQDFFERLCSLLNIGPDAHVEAVK